MEALLKHKIFLVLGLGILVAVVVWWGLSDTPASTSLLTSETVSDRTGADSGLVETLLQLRAVSLSGAILSDPAFRVLQDFGTQIIPEPIGRQNPFAPVSATVGTTTQNTQSATPAQGR